MRIFLLTPIYVTKTESSGATPVVHYFAKEWVKQGHEVYVFNLRAKYPDIWYWIAKKFKDTLNTKIGSPVHIDVPTEENVVEEGVHVKKINLKKYIPHSKLGSSQIARAVQIVSNSIAELGTPDIFIGHWDNPQLDVLVELKRKYGIPTALVFHTNTFALYEKYGKNVNEKLKMIDYLGFRNKESEAVFTKKHFKPEHSFIAYSGVSQSFIEAGKTFSPTFDHPVSKFAFVGLLIARKYPKEVVSALAKSYHDERFTLTLIGDGGEKSNIESVASENGVTNNINFTGRIPRESIIEHLKNAEVFVMISREEIFGLVYLEAMALGLIPIGSRNEGIDGIIVDGENGFLCEAGNEQELASIIDRIRKMSTEELKAMSAKAKATAFSFTDSKVAEHYINSLS